MVEIDPEEKSALRTTTAATQPIVDVGSIGAVITETAPSKRILSCIGESAEPPRISPARGLRAWDDLPVEAVPD